MSHSCLPNGLVHELYASHDMVIEALEKNNVEALEKLTETSLERLQGFLSAALLPETPEDYRAFLEVKDCIDRISRDLEQKKAEVFSQMTSLRKMGHGLKAYMSK